MFHMPKTDFGKFQYFRNYDVTNSKFFEKKIDLTPFGLSKSSFLTARLDLSQFRLGIVLSRSPFRLNNPADYFGAPKTVHIYIIHLIFFSNFVPFCFGALFICCSCMFLLLRYTVDSPYHQQCNIRLIIGSAASASASAKFAQHFVAFLCI